MNRIVISNRHVLRIFNCDVQRKSDAKLNVNFNTHRKIPAENPPTPLYIARAPLMKQAVKE
jgi:hypothetical protein